jgi:sugar/nucleoside kinase (ribokinase family)
MMDRAGRCPDMVVVGHVTIDETLDGRRPGGAAAYAALVGARLGLRTALVTCAGPDLSLAEILPGVQVMPVACDRTTIMEHDYSSGRRVQYARRRAEYLGPAAIPASLRAAPLALLGPVVDEVDPAVAQAFPQALIGAAAQGWLRRIGPRDLVEDGHLDGLNVAALAGRATLLFLSEDDLAGQPLPDAWLTAFPIVVVTRGAAGLRLHHADRWWRLAAFPAVECDPTGAGDALAAAFLIRYAETRSVAAAARFGAATAAFVVEARGTAGAPDRAAVERRLAQHPEVRLEAEVAGSRQ